MTVLVQYVGEVLKDDGDNYIGDFSGGVGADGVTPLGWAHGTSSFYSGNVNWASPGGLTGLFADFWGNPSDHVHQSIAPVLFEVPTLSAVISDDPSGPPGKEADKACILSGAGDNGGLFTWVGEDASNILGPSSYPAVDSGWHPDNGSIWCCSGWFKALQDGEGGADATGNTLQFFGAKYGYGTGGTAFIDAPFSLTLTQEWQYFKTRFQWAWSSGPALFGIELTTGWNHSETHDIDYGGFGHIELTKAGTLEGGAGGGFGSVAIKDVHLWNCQLIKPGYHSHIVLGPNV